MDYVAALVIAGVAGSALTGVAVGLVIRDRKLASRLASTERIVEQLRSNTVTKEKLMTEAQERQSSFVLQRAILLDQMDLLDRDSPGAVRTCLIERYPHLTDKL